MTDAVAAYDRHRFAEALRLSKEVSREAPTVAAVRRLAGFSAYRLGRWREALGHLEAYSELSGEPDAVPATMDCLRALGRSAAVAQRWTDLRHRSPDADLLAEARMVAAGSLADRGDLGGAIALLSAGGAARQLRNPSERHVRQWYALGDLYERAGDVPRARDLFLRVARADPDAYDLPERLAALGRVRAGSSSRAGRARRSARRDPDAKAAPGGDG